MIVSNSSVREHVYTSVKRVAYQNHPDIASGVHVQSKMDTIRPLSCPHFSKVIPIKILFLFETLFHLDNIFNLHLQPMFECISCTPVYHIQCSPVIYCI